MYKMRDTRANLLFCLSKPTALLPFSLLSPSSSLKLANDWFRGKQMSMFLNVSQGTAEKNIDIRRKQNSLFPEGPVIK